MIITDTKLDDTFSSAQILIQGFCTPFRLDRNKKGGGTLLHIRSHITSTQLNKCIVLNQIKTFLWKKSRIVYGFLVVHIIQINCRLYPTFKKIDSYSNKYEDILIIGDFNIDIQELSLHLFCNQYKIKSLNKDSTYYKNIWKPCCIDLPLSNSLRYLSCRNVLLRLP